MTPPNNVDSWLAYQHRVLGELERLDDENHDLRTRCAALERSYERLDVKSGMWGMLGGALVAALTWFRPR